MLNFLADNVETDSLRKRSALTNSDDITDSESECWGAVSSDGLVALLKSVVLDDVMEIITTDDDSVCHFVGDNNTPTCKVSFD